MVQQYVKTLDVTAFSKTLGARFFEVEKDGRKISKIQLQSNHTDSIYDELTNIKLENKQD